MNQYDKKKLLNYIDAVSFALIDTTLYLDTHQMTRKRLTILISVKQENRP
ncbi:MAG: spore coat protein CotJB [Anaerostipes hadrus]